MFFLPQDLDDYIVAHSQEEPVLLQELTRETYQKILQPIMLSGPYQGRVLSLISKLIAPKSILEVGTFTGYATLCLAEGLQKDGIIDTIERNEELIDFQSKYFNRSPYESQIKQHVGDALDIIPKLNKSYDLVFIDADKPNYSNYFHQVIDKVNPGGIILSDNVLWHGKVIEPVNERDISTKAVVEFNALLNEDPRVETIMLPIRDGLSVSRKL